jgi:NADH-quinone oxidoreductase subunit C
MTDPKVDNFAALLTERLGAALIAHAIDRGELTIVVDAGSVVDVAKTLRNDNDFAFHQLSDLIGIDYLSFGQADWQTRAATDSGFSRGVDKATAKLPDDAPARFAVVYQLLSLEYNFRLRMKVYLAEESPLVGSVVDVWPCADWYEREAFDLYGILFEGHPDLRRILTDYGFIGHPFRKDFPLEGHVEVRYDPDKKRVIYQPVTIENRVLVPRVIREDNRFATSSEGDEADA